MSPTRSTSAKTATSAKNTATAKPAARQPGRVAFVGAGPGDAGLMTVRAVEYLAAADVVVIDQVSREDVVARHCRPDVEVVDAGHGDHGQPLTHAMRAKLVVKAAKAAAGGLVVRLMDGDPATFNGLAEEALACHKAGIGFDVVPGVSAVSAVPAYAGIPLTSSTSQAVHVISANDRRVDWSASVSDHVTVVLLGAPDDLAEALGKLLDAGRSADTPVALTERGTTIRQVTRTSTLGEVAKVMKSVEFPALAVIGSTVSLREQLSWFETKPLFGWNILVPRTKEQSGTTIARLASYGATAQVVPTISVEPPRTPQQMERAIKGLVTGRYEWIGFTSVNAVKAVREKFEEFGLDARTARRRARGRARGPTRAARRR